jgi:hypothetical protein
MIKNFSLIICFFIIVSGFAIAQTWSTYYGGSGSDTINKMIEVDDYIYIIGTTSSSDNIATSSAYQKNLSGGADCFIVKFDKSGNRIWGTYFGGPDNEFGTSICYNPYKNLIIICGYTSSQTGIASNDADQPSFAGGNYDSFIAAFDLSGSLVWSTYLGGEVDDFANFVFAQTNDDKFVVVGQTNSTEINIDDDDVYQKTKAFGYDGFIAYYKIDDGKQDWITYFGGNGNDNIKSVFLDYDEIYFSGSTESDSGISKGNFHNKNYSGKTDGFFGKLKSKSELEWASYYGGSEFDELIGIYKNSGDLYVLGNTKSQNLASSNAYYKQLSGGTDVIFSVFPDEQPEFSSYFGGSNNEEAKDIYVFDDNFYIVGKTSSTNNICLKDSYHDSIYGNSDAFFCVYNNKYKLVYSSYIGGDGDESGNSIIGSKGEIYIAGTTTSLYGIANANSFQQNCGGLADGFISKYFDVNIKIKSINKTQFCSGDSIFVDYKVVGVIENSNVFFLEISDKDGSFSSPLDIGNIDSKISGTISSIIPLDLPQGTNYKIRIKANYNGETSDNYIEDIQVNAIPQPKIIGSNQLCLNSENDYTVTDDASQSYEWIVANGLIIGGNKTNKVKVKWNNPGLNKILVNVSNGICANNDSLIVNVIDLPGNVISGTKQNCLNSESYYSVSYNSSESYNWSVSGGLITEGINSNRIKVKWNNSGINRILLNVTNGICSNKDSIFVIVNNLPEVTLDQFPNKCVNDAVFDLSGGMPLGGKYFVDDIENTKFEPSITGIGKHKIEYIYSDSISCQNSFVQNIEVFDIPVKPLITKINEELVSNYNNGNQWYLDGIKINGADLPNYKPVKSGDYSLKVTNQNNCSSDFSDIINIVINSGAPFLTILTKPNFKILVCEDSDNSTLLLSNSGSSNLLLDSIKITGENNSDFSIENISNTTITPNQNKSIIIQFNPKSPGDKSAIVDIYTDSKQSPASSFNLNARKDISSFRFSNDIVDFGEVIQGKIYSREFWIINDGSIDLNWLYPFKSGYFNITEIIPSIIKPGDSAKATVQYFADYPGDITGNCKFNDSCLNSKTINFHVKINSVNVKPIINIEVGNVDARSGDELNVPIIIKDRWKVVDSGFTSINLVLDFNATLLHPIGKTPKGYVINGFRMIPLILDLTNDSIFVLPFQATLGDDSITALLLKNISINDSDFDIQARDGLFRLLDLCNAGGTRLIKFDGEITLSILTNPAFEFLDFSVNLIENGNTKIFIANYNGEIVKSIINNYANKGKFDTRIDISNLSSGNYFIKLLTPTFNKTYKFNIVK